MNLRELRAAHPMLFHPHQTWFVGELFMESEAVPVAMPARVRPWWSVVGAMHPGLVSAASLCARYVLDPADPIWTRYLWTSDLDQYGQRVYIGDNGLGLEIHRHLHLTERWGVPLWS